MTQNDHDENEEQDDDAMDEEEVDEEQDDDETVNADDEEEDPRPRISEPDIQVYFQVKRQLESFSQEIGIISKKKADSPLNKFKLDLINYTLSNTNKLLGDSYRPFPSFTLIDVEASLPSASDVSVILSQYISALDKFHSDYTDHDGYKFIWRRKLEEEESDGEEDDTNSHVVDED